MALLSKKAQKALTHAWEAKAEEENKITQQRIERKAKRAALARQVDDPTPCKPLQTPSQDLIDRRNEQQYQQDVAEIDAMHEL